MLPTPLKDKLPYHANFLCCKPATVYVHHLCFWIHLKDTTDCIHILHLDSGSRKCIFIIKLIKTVKRLSFLILYNVVRVISKRLPHKKSLNRDKVVLHGNHVHISIPRCLLQPDKSLVPLLKVSLSLLDLRCQLVHHYKVLIDHC